jgi:DNA-binding phage protein
MRKARAFDAAKYRDNPKMIAKYLNHALATGDGIIIAQAIGAMIHRFNSRFEAGSASQSYLLRDSCHALSTSRSTYS